MATPIPQSHTPHGEPATTIVDLDTFEPTDAQILSWHAMMTGPDQLPWEYDESWAHEPATPQKEIASFRQRRAAQRGTNHPLWALAPERVIGMIGINRFTDTPRRHSAELGFGVTVEFARRGIGTRLLTAAIAKARLLGLQRLEADCFEDNLPSIALLRKCGFQPEGLRLGAICKHNQLRNTCHFGLLL